MAAAGKNRPFASSVPWLNQANCRHMTAVGPAQDPADPVLTSGHSPDGGTSPAAESSKGPPPLHPNPLQHDSSRALIALPAQQIILSLSGLFSVLSSRLTGLKKGIKQVKE